MDVWGYTPAQAYAFAELAKQRVRQERAHQLEMTAMAVRGESKTVLKTIKKLAREE
jgi:hypothetical protein